MNKKNLKLKISHKQQLWTLVHTQVRAQWTTYTWSFDLFSSSFSWEHPLLQQSTILQPSRNSRTNPALVLFGPLPIQVRPIYPLLLVHIKKLAAVVTIFIGVSIFMELLAMAWWPFTMAMLSAYYGMMMVAAPPSLNILLCKWCHTRSDKTKHNHKLVLVLSLYASQSDKRNRRSSCHSRIENWGCQNDK